MRTTPLTPPPLDAIALGNHRRVRLGRALGQGSFARVYEGWLEERSGVRRPVAVKLFGVLATDEADAILDALSAAAERAACVLHPNVVAVYDLGVHAGQPFLVTELVRGASLRALMDRFSARERRVPLGLGLFVALEVADALTAASVARGPDGREVGLVHGELSARDVLLTQAGAVKVTDFELDGARHAASDVRSLKAVARRCSVLAPEVACGEPADARSDVFSLGLLLREMLVGPRFARGTSDAEIVGLAQRGVVEPMTFQPQLPREVFDVIERATAVDPIERFPHAASLAFELRRVALSLGTADERVFLRQTLAIELADELSEVTRPATPSADGRRAPSAPPALPRPATPPQGIDRFARLQALTDRTRVDELSDDDLDDDA